MEDKHEEFLPPEEETAENPPYVPRPHWQVWTARVALVLLLLFLMAYYINIARGGA